MTVRAERYCKLKLPGSSCYVSKISDDTPRRGAYGRSGPWLIESLNLGDGIEDKKGMVMTAGVIHGSPKVCSKLKKDGYSGVPCSRKENHKGRKSGVGEIINGVGSRTKFMSSAIKKAELKGELRLRAATHNFVRAALTLKSASQVVQRLKNAASLCRVERDSKIQSFIQGADRWDAFKMIAEAMVGVYIVRMRQDSVVVHAVTARR
eukprot:IDg12701t1